MKTLLNRTRPAWRIPAMAVLVAMAVGPAQTRATTSLVTPDGVSLDASSQFFPVGNLVNNSGLSGAATVDNYTGITHAGANAGNAWVTDGSGADYYAAPVGTTPVLTFDLGATTHLSDLVVWGYHFGSPNNNEAKTFSLEFSTDGGSTYGDAVVVDHARTGPAQETLNLGGVYTADTVRMTITDNHRGTPGAAGGDRVGLGEVKFLAVDSISDGKAYSYTRLPQFSGGTYYFDEPHVQTTGVFDTGDLTDGEFFLTSPPTVPTISTIVGWGGTTGPNLDTEIVIDLEMYSLINGVRLGTHVWSPFANGAPDDVVISFSDDNVTFTDAVFASFTAPAGNGREDFYVDTTGSTGRYVKLSFDGGAVLNGNTPNKWMLDELTVFGVELPEPATASLGMLAFGVLAMRRRRGGEQG